MRDFLKYVLASFTGALLFLVFLSTLLVLGAFGLASFLLLNLGKQEPTALVKRDSILVYDLSTVIRDSQYIPQSPSLLLAQGGLQQELALRNAVNAIREAAKDDRIVGLYLQGSPLGVGLDGAGLVAMEAALREFQATDKPILAYDTDWTEGEYFLATQADTVALNPLGSLELNGLYTEVRYQAEALNKLGVEVQVTRVGKYKSAVEPLILNAMSLEEREQTQRLISDIWVRILQPISERRALSLQQLQTLANNQAVFPGQEAQKQKLVDRVAYLDEIIQELRTLTGEEEKPENGDSFRQISLYEYAQGVSDPLTELFSSNQIALVYAEGPILDGAEADPGFPVIAGDALAQEIRTLRQDDAVKAIVLRVNSPGGSAIASDVILREIRLAQAAGKPVVVSMGSVAASGGYWIASSADKIYAEPTTITGSIGVFGFFINLDNLGDKIGVNWEIVKTNPKADIFSITRPRSGAELTILQNSVDQIYNEFLTRVAEGRKLPRAKVNEIAQGRVWSGTAAKNLGLVDELGGLDDAIQAAAQLAELGDDWSLQQYPQLDQWQRFLETLFEPSRVQAQDPLTANLASLKQEITILSLLNNSNPVFAWMPYTLEFR